MTCPTCGQARTITGACGCDDDVSSLLSLLGDLDEAAPAPVTPAPAAAPVTPAAAEPHAAATPTAPAAGWYADPMAGAPHDQLRWWDGAAWTESTRLAATAVAPVAAAVGTAPAAAPAPAPAGDNRPPLPGSFGSPAGPASPPPGWGVPILRTGEDFAFNPPVPARRTLDVSALGRAKLLVGVVVLALVAAGVAYVLQRPDGPLYPKAWDPRVADLVRFVEDNRGSAFAHPVAVEFLPVAEFKKKVSGGVDDQKVTDEDRVELERSVATLRALGLVTGKIDLREAVKKLFAEGVIGQYDPSAKKVWVRGTELTPAVKVTIVHELTHALQDQRFDLKKLQDDEEHDTSIRALIEADAERVEDMYVESLSDADREAYEKASEAEGDEADFEGVPDVLQHWLAFPYVFGPTFVEALVKDGGTEAVDRAFHDPPLSEAEILDPRLYLDGLQLDEPPAPRPGQGEKAVEDFDGPFGQESMVEVMAPVVGFEQAWTALKGWRGDSSAVFVSTPAKGAPEKLCVAVNTRFATPADAAAFAAMAQKWAAAVNGTVANESGTIAMRVCDPGESAKGLPKMDPDAFEILSVRAMMLHEFLGQDEATLDKAVCVADLAARALDPATVALIPEIDENDPRAEEVFTDIASAIEVGMTDC